MPRGIKIGKIISQTRPNRDWENIPLERIGRAVKKMPSPGNLDPAPPKKILVTLYLNEFSVRYFKKEAERCHTGYQRLMRAVLDYYAAIRRSDG